MLGQVLVSHGIRLLEVEGLLELSLSKHPLIEPRG